MAICIAGLRVSFELLGKKRKWQQTAKEMSQAFADVYSNNIRFIPRTYRKGVKARNRKIRIDDLKPDTSLLG